MPSSPRPSGCSSRPSVPIVVAAEAQHVGKTTLLTALLDFLPPTSRVVELAGEDETFDWLPQASELGWPGVARPAAAGSDPVRPATTVLLAHELSDHTPAYTWGAAARVAVRAASIGYGLAATIHADSLDEVFDSSAGRRSGWPTTSCRISASSSSLRRLDDGRRRVVAAHYVRPMARDAHGHLQRLGPGRPRDLGPGDGRLRAVRLGDHPGARAPGRTPGGRLRDRGGPPSDRPRRPRRRPA